MNDDEIIVALRAERLHMSAVGLANLLDRLTNGGLSHATLVMYFKRAFPDVPLRALLDAGEWRRIGRGGLSDEEFENILRPWLTGCSGPTT